MSVVDAPSYDGDLFTDAAIQEPHGHYARIRESGAALWPTTRGAVRPPGSP
jgi:hypothetical protein